MRQYLTFNGGDSRDYGVYISGQGAFNAPAREYELISIPGRDGDLTGFEKRLANVEVTYPAFIYTNFRQNIRDFRSFLLSSIGYCRLEDTYNADEFRLALYRGGLEAEVLSNNKAGNFEITFECKPQRYLKTGEIVTTLTASGAITNPTPFPSAPLLRVYGAGTLGIGSQSIIITEADVYTDIDCEIMEAFKGTESKNYCISNSGTDFPKLTPGLNGITLGTGITRVDITPRWFMV